jgi:myo-inositol-1(or 4)-monophosphatase
MKFWMGASEADVMIDNASLHARHLAACAVAREAGALAKRRFLDRASFTVGLKGPQDYITEVDGEVERLIRARLIDVFSQDGFIGEEGAGVVGGEGQPVWLVDPIDGTSNFARGAPHFCVSIACLNADAIEIGVIYEPMLDELFSARRGGGATLNGLPMRVAETSSLDRATIEVGWNLRRGSQSYVDLLGRILATGAGAVRSGSGALGLAYVAAARRDGYVENHINAWDCLAGILLVREAGGYASNFLAGEGLRKGGPLLACAPGVRQALLAAAAIEGLAM